jgi:Zn-dependent M16 (insulinase) family peptidase
VTRLRGPAELDAVMARSALKSLCIPRSVVYKDIAPYLNILASAYEDLQGTNKHAFEEICPDAHSQVGALDMKQTAAISWEDAMEDCFICSDLVYKRCFPKAGNGIGDILRSCGWDNDYLRIVGTRYSNTKFLIVDPKCLAKVH